MMFRRLLRWILPLMVLMLIAAYLVFTPVLASHAASPTSNAQNSIQVIQQHSFDEVTREINPYRRFRP
ncbi:MAG TPA: hypothetical protein VFA09_02670 [Ktedonobacteraceae bacterium]|jgi:hypothetical protein|nr:hypothetical protein [Ktedonobacteraceae bacterium]